MWWKIKDIPFNKARIIAASIVAVVGIVLTLLAFFNVNGLPNEVATISGNTKPTVLLQKTTDEFEHNDEKYRQCLDIKVLTGTHAGKTFQVTNDYLDSQLNTEDYKVGQRVLVSFDGAKPGLVSPKRDWVLVLALTIMCVILVMVVGKKSFLIMISMILNMVLFYFFVVFDVAENSTKVVPIYSLAVLVLSLLSLALVQGIHKKMWLTWFATIIGVFTSFLICWGVMQLTHESGIRYEAVDFATQNPKTLFLAQALIGVLGAVMDEATDIISSLSELIEHQPTISLKQLWQSGRTIGQEIMGPLINVLVLIFMAEALPMTILLIRDLNTINYTFEFALSIGILQSLISAIGIVLTVPIATGFSLLLRKGKVVESGVVKWVPWVHYYFYYWF